MKNLQQIKKSDDIFWISFDSPKECKVYLTYLKRMGFKWFNGKSISAKDTLSFYFTIEVNQVKKTVGFIPCFQRFTKKHLVKQ